MEPLNEGKYYFPVEHFPCLYARAEYLVPAHRNEKCPIRRSGHSNGRELPTLREASLVAETQVLHATE